MTLLDIVEHQVSAAVRDAVEQGAGFWHGTVASGGKSTLSCGYRKVPFYPGHPHRSPHVWYATRPSPHRCWWSRWCRQIPRYARDDVPIRRARTDCGGARVAGEH